MSNNLFILCEHGLGNRLGSLIGGLKAAELVKYSPTICWPVNNYCHCEFNDLFENTFNVLENDLSLNLVRQIQDKGLPWFFISTIENNEISKNLMEPHVDSLHELKKLSTDLIYAKNKVVKSIANKKQVSEIISQLKINRSILEKVKKYCKDKNIDSNTIGLHIRKTDSHDIIDENTIFQRVKASPSTQYFLCSDNKETEKRFLELPNVKVYQKESEVEKFSSGDWREEQVDSDGRIIPWNVHRPKQQIIDAFIDMLILSRTSVDRMSRSTFRAMAERFSSVDIFK